MKKKKILGEGVIDGFHVPFFPLYKSRVHINRDFFYKEESKNINKQTKKWPGCNRIIQDQKKKNFRLLRRGEDNGERSPELL